MKKIIVVTLTILAIAFYGGLSNVHALEIGDTFAFSDTVGSITIGDPVTTWTHILDLDDFIPNLSGTESLEITSANLIIKDMDYSYESVGGGVGMYFSVLALDGYFLDRYWESGTSDEAGPLSWSIDIPNEVMLDLIADREVQIQLTVTAGTLNSIGSATLQGSGAVVPEPSILSLVMFGLAGMPFIGPMIRRRRKI